MRLRLKEKISSTDSKSMTLDFVRYGDHEFDSLRSLSEEHVAEFFADDGYEFRRLIRECRKFGVPVPMLENLLGGTWHVISEGSVVEASVMDENENVMTSIPGPGQLSFETYGAMFQQANRQFNRAIDSAFSQYDGFLVCCSSIISSIEA